MRLSWFLVGLLLVFALPDPAHAYVSPTTGAAFVQGIQRPFDKPERNWLPGHRGVDLAAPPGSPIRAAETGEVVFAGSIAGKPTISIQHGDGIRTTYQPVHPHVAAGMSVGSGQVIGTLAGSEGLHWGALKAKDDYINPLSLLDAPTIRLKPVDAPDQKPL
ncbi:M23 family metallopeptidase [Corynebacterium sp. H128]|uniref:M23 family metallopeptidase n=1 Tax=Corynebacterium sp. H128 TaxID=3133427 RepID=UPI00309492D9